MKTTAQPHEHSPAHLAWIAQHRREKRKIRGTQVLLLVSILALWELAARMKWIDTFLFSSPSAIVDIFRVYFLNGTIWAHIGITMWETFVGFFIGTFCGIGIAILLWWWPVLSRILDPFLVVLNALPKTALAPIVIVWFGAGLTGIIAVAVSICIVVTILSAYTDFRSVDADKIRMRLCLIGVIVGEFLVSRSGIGYLIVYGSQVFRLDLVMMGVVILAVCAWILNSLINLLERHIKKS